MVSRSHSGTTDGWKEANHSSLMAPSDQVHSKSSRQFLLQTQGKQIPMFRYNGSSGGSKSDGGSTNYNVVKTTRTEKIVEHTSTVPAAPLINKHRLPPWDHDQHSNSRDFGVDDEDHRHRRSHPAGPDSDINHNNYSDDKFEEFINRVRDEAQRRGTTTTTTNKPAAVALPLSSAWRSVVPQNPRNNNYVQENNIINTTKYEGPNNNNAGSGHSLSKPTNQVGTAMEFLKEAMKPPFNGKEKEIIGLINNSSAYKDSRPAATVAKSSTGDPYSHQVVTAAPGKKKGPAAPEKIDSREATKRYGKLLSRSTMDEEEYEYQGIITSREALEKYNGVCVP